jgi:uncharacterized membrane protein YfcA
VDISSFILILSTGLFAGGFGAAVGSSLLVIFPSLVFLGVPPHVALGTGKLSAIFRDIPALINYHKSRKVDYRTGGIFILSAIAGTVLASLFALSLAPRTLEIIISICMILVGLVIIANPSAGLREGPLKNSGGSVWKIAPFGLMIGLYDGIFGGGVSIFIILLFVFRAGHDYLTAVGTSKVPNIITCVVFVGIFAAHGKVDYIYAIPLVIGMTIGGHVGSKIALVQGNRYVRGILICVVFAMAIKLLLF